jgi:hypothetical protein
MKLRNTKMNFVASYLVVRKLGRPIPNKGAPFFVAALRLCYQLVISFFNVAPLIMEFTAPKIQPF